ncbi:MAG: hypothetical protein EXQ95_15175, partial [Alphaproteobacteria bacterium]|nr:hypothetical protein [Alphaproteobacteria bacterium]
MAADGRQPDPSTFIADALDGIGRGLLIFGPDDRLAVGDRRFREMYGIDEAPVAPAVDPDDIPVFDREILDELFEDSTKERRSHLDLFSRSAEQLLS